MRRAMVLAGAATLSACGGGATDRRDPETVVVRPPAQQLLAYATATEVGVLLPGGPKVLARIPPSTILEPFVWSGDGRHVAWRERTTTSAQVLEVRLRLADVRTGTVRSWPEVYDPMAPTPTGVSLTHYDSRFTEYLPDGGTIAYRVALPLPAKDRKSVSKDVVPDTQVALAVPRRGEWTVAARNTADTSASQQFAVLDYRVGAAGPSGPATGRVQGGTLDLPVRLDDRRIAWVRREFDGECALGDQPSGLGLLVPRLPPSIGAGWVVRRLVAARGTLHVLARRIAIVDGGGRCLSQEPADEGAYVWLRMGKGRWDEVRRGVAELAVAEDGRVATVDGAVGRPSAPGPGAPTDPAPFTGPDVPLRHGAAVLVGRDGARTTLPPGTRSVGFSPAHPMTLRRAAGSGPPVSLRSRVGSTGLGPLRVGATVDELRAATATPLVVTPGPGRCSTLRVADLRLDNRLGFRGSVVDGRLVRVTITTRDRKPDEDGYEIGDLQPGVQKIERRGPPTTKGFRVGERLNDLVLREGAPAERRIRSRLGAVDYVYRRDGGTMVARSDAAAVVRRIDVYQGDTAPDCP